MFTWFNRFLSIITILLTLGCKISSTSVINKDDDDKVNVIISGSKKSGLKINN